MSDLDPTTALLQDSFDRVRDLVASVTDDLDLEAATFRVDAEANTVAWLVWHLTRIQDDHVAGLSDEEQAWESWRERFDLPFDDDATGYGQSSDDVAAVRVDGELLAGYHADVDALTRRYLDSLTTEELERVVDERWDPPVTASARLVSVLGDCLQHLGQASFVLGVASRR
ncbi:hypothetical protein ASD11_10545 [Aeromicrobium sp. Root495]|uniref:mycothiol transferase n=1 Tax=Aeromicrobium sp. Root495 TaxID=1736550 RepID=UPI0006F613FB|nr:DinB family protein [Aeromicrobium sp. Root495]KQY59936.1 hypothetical protein ASD11_10545 [Aeromicrobium sp. Root495]